MRAPLQEGEFPYPVKYATAPVGRVEAGPDELRGRTVFALHPHQDVFVAPAAMLLPGAGARAAAGAVLAANMETALNALWDSGAGPGDRIVVVGAGVVGALNRLPRGPLPGAEVTLVDVDLGRADLAAALGCRFRKPLDAPGDADVVFHASATALASAAPCRAPAWRRPVVEMSWYGDAPVSAPLGLDFHSRRLRLVSSQVGQLSPSRRPRWDFRRRLDKALSLLADERHDCAAQPGGSPSRASRRPARALAAGARRPRHRHPLR
jgi:threonine dehydrogenase-like Zn-dependent dehydrogenase